MNNKLFFKILYITLVLIFTCSNLCFATDSMYVWSNASSAITTNADANTETTTSTNPLNLESGSAILIEQSTGQILYEHSPPHNFPKENTLLPQ